MIIRGLSCGRLANKWACSHVDRSIRFLSLTSSAFSATKPTASEALTCYLEQCEYPPWTSYFIKYSSIIDDQRGKSHFNWQVREGQNYHILRTGCYPYIKYHCTKRPYQDLSLEDYIFRVIKVINLGIPCLAYGIAAQFLISHVDTVITSKGPVNLYFLYKEDIGSSY